MERIRVFITEDESIVREGLRDMIPWSDYGLEFVGDAPDGEMALPLLRKLKPDILITDIKMPFMDGISLSQIIRRELPETKIIILSGYDDFEYARKAIELNVDQFLLKPITKAEMIQALETAKAHIEEEQEQKHYLQQYEQELKRFERFSRRDFFEKLVGGSLSVQEIYEQAGKLHLDLTAEQYNFVVFTLQDTRDGSFSSSAENILKRAFELFPPLPRLYPLSQQPPLLCPAHQGGAGAAAGHDPEERGDHPPPLRGVGNALALVCGGGNAHLPAEYAPPVLWGCKPCAGLPAYLPPSARLYVGDAQGRAGVRVCV